MNARSPMPLKATNNNAPISEYPPETGIDDVYKIEALIRLGSPAIAILGAIDKLRNKFVLLNPPEQTIAV